MGMTFDEWLARADELMLVCRDLGHQWPSYTDKRAHYAKSRRTGRISIEMPCLRDCGVIRTRHLGSRGELEGNANTYSYPDGYLFKGTDVRTPGRNVTKDHKEAIRETLVSLVPESRFEWVE